MEEGVIDIISQAAIIKYDLVITFTRAKGLLRVYCEARQSDYMHLITERVVENGDVSTAIDMAVSDIVSIIDSMRIEEEEECES